MKLLKRALIRFKILRFLSRSPNGKTIWEISYKVGIHSSDVKKEIIYLLNKNKIQKIINYKDFPEELDFQLYKRGK